MAAGRKTTFGRGVFSLALAALALAACSARDGDPENIPDMIRTKETRARQDWKRDAFLTNLLIQRDKAGAPFRYDFAFRSSDDMRLYHIHEEPDGKKTGVASFTNDPRALGVIPTSVIDLPAALKIARDHGMKGNLATAELFEWFPLPSQPVMAWRIVPDKAPDLADPNDPNQKNYWIDALTQAAYDPESPDPKDVQRGSLAIGPAVAADMSAFAKSLPH
jgi:hypothetical protein